MNNAAFAVPTPPFRWQVSGSNLLSWYLQINESVHFVFLIRSKRRTTNERKVQFAKGVNASIVAEVDRTYLPPFALNLVKSKKV